MEAKQDLILIVDDDPDLLRFVEVNLRFEGFEVATATDGEMAIEQAHNVKPDLVLLDVMMPKLNGFEVCQRLRGDPRTQHLSIIMLTAKALSADKVVGLTAGADDYIIKPFDPMELIARVKSALQRSRELRSVNPLTKLPGHPQIQAELDRRLEATEPFALMYLDLDNFKAFNDHNGFLRGDEAIKLLGACIGNATKVHGGSGGFVGHIGGDDFVAIVDGPRAERVAKNVIQCWERQKKGLYDDQDAQRGYIEISDRRNQTRHFPLSTVSIGIATNAHRELRSHWEASEIASEMKQFAKREAGSSFAIDRRREETAGALLEQPPGAAARSS